VRAQLLTLSSSILSSAASPLRSPRSRVLRKKSDYVDFLLMHSSAWKAQISFMAHDDILNHLSSTAVPHGCPRTRSTILASEFVRLYGDQVATAFRTPPQSAAAFDVPTPSAAVSSASPTSWLSVSIDDLTRRLEKLSRADILHCLSRLPTPFRKMLDLRSHRKTCNALVNHIRYRALSLFHADPRTLADVFVAHFPFAVSNDMSSANLLTQILDHEFG
jgi:hypothetical protein